MKYVKQVNDPTFYLVDDDGTARPLSSPAEMHQIGILPVEVVPPGSIPIPDDLAGVPLEEDSPARIELDLTDGVDDDEASVAGRALVQRRKQIAQTKKRDT